MRISWRQSSRWSTPAPSSPKWTVPRWCS